MTRARVGRWEVERGCRPGPGSGCHRCHPSVIPFAMILGVACILACGGGAASSTTATPVGSTGTSSATLEPAAATGVPAEVTKLLERWETCWHFAGEEPYDAERSKQIADGIAKSCPGNEEERTRLEAKYASRADVMRELAKLDDMQ